MDHGDGYRRADPMPMPQSQPIRRSNVRNPADPTVYPPGSPRSLQDSYQPALDSGAFDQAVMDQGMGAAFDQIVSDDNNKNYGSIGIPYTYKIDQSIQGFIQLAPNATGEFAINISADANFIIYQIVGQATRNCTFTINNSGADRLFQNRPLSAIEMFGTAQRAFNLAVPQMVNAKTSLQLRITDLGAGALSPFTFLPVADANLQPDLEGGPDLFNRISIAFRGVKRVPMAQR